MKYFRDNVLKALKSPLAKGIYISIPLCFAFHEILNGFGFEESVIVKILGGLIIYLLVDYYLQSDLEKKNTRQNAFELYKEKGYTIGKCGVLIGIAIAFSYTIQIPEDPFVAMVYNLVSVIGLSAVFLIPAGFIVFNTTREKYRFSEMFPYEKILSGIAVYAVMMSSISLYGAPIKFWVLSDPSYSASIAVAALLIWMIVKIMYYMFSPFFTGEYSDGMGSSAGSMTMKTALNPNPSERDINYIAAHEAGHAMVFAALGSLPPGMEAVVKDGGGNGSASGYVSNLISMHQLDERTFSEWMMLVLLSGRLGELYSMGESTLGSEGDHRRWLVMAKRHLASHFEGIYYSNPVSKLELEANEEKLMSLKARQLLLLETFFKENKSTHESITALLIQKKRLGRDDLTPLFRHVTFPNGFPFPLGKFDEFTDEWPQWAGLTTYNDLSAISSSNKTE